MTRAASTTAPADTDDTASLYSRRFLVPTVGIAAVMFLTGFAALAVVPLLPTAALDLDGIPLYPLVAGCFVAASLVGGVLGGAWADRSGATKPLAAGVALAVATLLVSATSQSIWQLAAGRFLDGLAAGMTAVAVNTAIAQTYPARLRAKALSLISACWIVPSLAGPPLGGLVADWTSWRVVFYGLAVLTAVPALVVIAVLRRRSTPPQEPAPESEDEPARPPLLTASVTAVAAAALQYAASGWDAPHLWTAAGAVAVLAVLAPRLLPPGTVRAARGLPATVLLRALASGTFFTIEAFVPLLLSTSRKVAPAYIGLVFTGAALVWAGASWLQANALARVARHRLVALGACVMALAAALAAASTLRSVPALTAGAAMLLAALGMGVMAPSLTLLSLAHTPAHRQGYASGAMQTSQNLGQVAVLAIGFAAFNAVRTAASSELGAYAAAFALLAVPILTAALLAVRTRNDPATSG